MGPNVADVVLQPQTPLFILLVVFVMVNPPDTSQSPAVREIEVALAGVEVVSEKELAVAEINSPTFPAPALEPLVMT